MLAARQHIRVLLVSANPIPKQPIDIQTFARAVKDKIQIVTGHKPKPITFEDEFSARPNELLDALKRTHPNVVHFYGHGHEQGITFTTEKGSTTVLIAALKDLFASKNASTVKCIVLTACNSAETAKTLAEVVDFTVGTVDSPTNEESTTFAARFYNEIVDGKSYEEAVESGNLDLKLLQYKVTFTLFTKPGAISA